MSRPGLSRRLSGRVLPTFLCLSFSLSMSRKQVKINNVVCARNHKMVASFS